MSIKLETITVKEELGPRKKGKPDANEQTISIESGNWAKQSPWLRSLSFR